MSAPAKYYPAHLEGTFDTPREALGWIAPKIGLVDSDFETAMAWASGSLPFTVLLPGEGGHDSVLIQEREGKFLLWRAMLDLMGEREEAVQVVEDFRNGGAPGTFAIFQFFPAQQVRPS